MYIYIGFLIETRTASDEHTKSKTRTFSFPDFIRIELAFFYLFSQAYQRRLCYHFRHSTSVKLIHFIGLFLFNCGLNFEY